MKALSLTSRILIVGAGAWGNSGSLELARRGYTNITVFDAYPFPSAISAANDINKIFEDQLPPSLNDSLADYTLHTITARALESWRRDPVFSPYFHETGFITSSQSEAGWPNQLDYVKGREWEFELLDSPEKFRATMPEGVLTGAFDGWKGFYQRTGAGWLFAKAAMGSARQAAIDLGVEYIAGAPEGKVESLLYNGNHTDVVGVRTADGTEHAADYVILAAGANNALLFDFGKQLRPTAWTLAHVPLTDAEAPLYRNLPVLYNERGFFIEPDADRHELKVCDEHPGYINPVVAGAGANATRSVPFAREQIPVEAERRMRDFLNDTMPQFAQREFTYGRICWDADTYDRMYLIDKHPQYRSLVFAAGASGHGFKVSPAIGPVIADCLEDIMDPRFKEVMRWRPETVADKDWYWDPLDRTGADGKVMNFQNVSGWTSFGELQSESFDKLDGWQKILN